MDGDAALDAFRARLTRLGASCAEDAAKEAAPLIEAAARETAAAGTTPKGEAWKPTLKGTKPLKNAAESIKAKVLGPVVQIVIGGHHFFHHMGFGVPKRQIIPDAADGIPPRIAAAAKKAAEVVFGRVMKGGG